MRFFVQLATNLHIDNKLASCKEGVTRSATCELCWKLQQKVEPIQLFLQLATRQKCRRLRVTRHHPKGKIILIIKN